MTPVQCNESANVMSELYFESLRRLDLLKALNEVPFKIQRRGSGFSRAARCLALLASQAQGCVRLTDWSLRLRQDSRLCHWLGDRPGPHPSTLSRTLAATDQATVRALRQQVLVPLSDQVLLAGEATGRWVFVDIDNKGIPAEGKDYEGTSYGRMSDGRRRRGYRLHLLSLGNRWPLEMELTGAKEHAVPWAMVMLRRYLHRLSGQQRRRMVVRADGNHGCVRFIRFLQRHPCGYLLKSYNPYTARKLWEQTRAKPGRIDRPDQPDLLALDCGATTLTGMTRKRCKDGRTRRRQCRVAVPRVVVYREDPRQLPADKQPECFCLITTLKPRPYPPRQLLEAYLQRAGDVENIFCQLDQAFRITHMRSRRFFGNYTFLLLAMVAATLTQMVREDAMRLDLPIPPGLKQVLVAAWGSGLRLQQHPEAGCVLSENGTGEYALTFRKALRCCYQHRFRYAA
jgi:hypothetical protein